MGQASGGGEPEAVARRHGDPIERDASRLSSTLGAMLEEREAADAYDAPLFPTKRALLVREQIKNRRHREQYFPADLFSDPAWDILLDLYAAHYERSSVSVTSLCIAAAVPTTTALRWIKALCDRGLLERAEDPKDGRRTFIQISRDTRAKLDKYFSDTGE